MPRPYSALAIANAFIAKAGPGGINHLAIQKLVYLSEGWWLGYRDTRLCADLPEVWTYGPIYARLYHTLKHFGLERIRTPQSPHFLARPPQIEQGDADAQKMIDWIWSRYGHLSHLELSTLAHAPGTPWAEMIHSCGYRASQGTVIPQSMLTHHFRAKARKLSPASSRVLEDA